MSGSELVHKVRHYLGEKYANPDAVMATLEPHDLFRLVYEIATGSKYTTQASPEAEVDEAFEELSRQADRVRAERPGDVDQFRRQTSDGSVSQGVVFPESGRQESYDEPVEGLPVGKGPAQGPPARQMATRVGPPQGPVAPVRGLESEVAQPDGDGEALDRVWAVVRDAVGEDEDKADGVYEKLRELIGTSGSLRLPVDRESYTDNERALRQDRFDRQEPARLRARDQRRETAKDDFYRSDEEIRLARDVASGRWRYEPVTVDGGGPESTVEGRRTGDKYVVGGDPIGGEVVVRTLNPKQQAAERERAIRALGPNATVDQISRIVANTPTEAVSLYDQGAEHIPLGWAPERVARLQRQLVEAGVLEGTFRNGYWDRETSNAYTTLLAEANRQARRWEEVLPDMQIAYEHGIQAERAEAIDLWESSVPSYRAPDLAELRDVVRAEFARRVGRDPSSAEMATYTGEMAAWYRQQYDADTAAERAAFQRQVGMDPRAGERQILEGGLSGPLPAGIPSAPQAGPADVSPSARLAEMLAARLQPEADMRASRDPSAPRSVFNTADAIRRMAGA